MCQGRVMPSSRALLAHPKPKVSKGVEGRPKRKKKKHAGPGWTIVCQKAMALSNQCLPWGGMRPTHLQGYAEPTGLDRSIRMTLHDRECIAMDLCSKLPATTRQANLYSTCEERGRQLSASAKRIASKILTNECAGE